MEEGCTKTRPFSWLKYLIVRASGSSSTAPEEEAANFLSGRSIRASWGLKAEAIKERIRGVFVVLRFRAGECEFGMKDNSRREERYWILLEEISFRVW